MYRFFVHLPKLQIQRSHTAINYERDETMVCSHEFARIKFSRAKSIRHDHFISVFESLKRAKSLQSMSTSTGNFLCKSFFHQFCTSSTNFTFFATTFPPLRLIAFVVVVWVIVLFFFFLLSRIFALFSQIFSSLIKIMFASINSRVHRPWHTHTHTSTLRPTLFLSVCLHWNDVIFITIICENSGCFCYTTHTHIEHCCGSFIAINWLTRNQASSCFFLAGYGMSNWWTIGFWWRSDEWINQCETEIYSTQWFNWCNTAIIVLVLLSNVCNASHGSTAVKMQHRWEYKYTEN